MADTGAFADLAASIKETYVPGVVEPLLNNELVFRPWLKSAAGLNHELGGYATFIANLGGDQALGQAADNSALPPTVDRTDLRLQLKPSAFYGALQLGILTMNAVDSDTNSWNRGELKRQMNDRLEQMGKFMESTYTGTHGTGRRARVEAEVGTNTFTAALPEGTMLLRKGMLVSGRSTDAGSVSGSFDNQRITAINPDTRLVTYGGTDRTTTAGDHIHVVTEASQTLTGGVFANGLRGLVDDATYLDTVHGKSRATYPDIKSQRFSNGGVLRNLSEQILLQACMTTRARSGKNITDIWMSPGQALKWVEFLAPDQRRPVTSGTGNKEMGFKEGDLRLTAPGIGADVHISYDIVPREVYLLNRDTFFIYNAKDTGPLTDQLLHLSPASASFKASMIGYLCAVENIGINGRFDANAVISDLSDPLIGD